MSFIENEFIEFFEDCPCKIFVQRSSGPHSHEESIPGVRLMLVFDGCVAALTVFCDKNELL